MGTTTMRIVPLCWVYRDYSSILAGSYHAHNGISVDKIGSPTTPHRISETFLSFSKVTFTTSEMELDYHQKLNVRVASRVENCPKTNETVLGNRKISGKS